MFNLIMSAASREWFIKSFLEEVSLVTALPGFFFVTVIAGFKSTGGRDSNGKVTGAKIKKHGGYYSYLCCAAV